MKNRIIPIFILVSMILFSACKKDNNTLLIRNDDYLIFGRYAGECSGNCAEFYKIINNNIYADENVYYFGIDSLKFSSNSLSNRDFIKSKILLSNFPTYLLNNKNTGYGCPDCADQGGISIVLQKDGEISYWNIDTNTDTQPEEIRDYVQLINTVISEL